MRKTCVVLLLLIAPNLAWSDESIGAQKARNCVGCHGLKGIASAPNFPNLAGQKVDYLRAAIQAYRSGKRVDPTMTAMVTLLSEEDVEILANYFAGLEPK